MTESAAQTSVICPLCEDSHPSWESISYKCENVCVSVDAKLIGYLFQEPQGQYLSQQKAHQYVSP